MKMITAVVIFSLSALIFAENSFSRPPELYISGTAQGNIPEDLQSWTDQFTPLLFAFLSQETLLLEGTKEQYDNRLIWNLNFQSTGILWRVELEKEEDLVKVEKYCEQSLPEIQKTIEEIRSELIPALTPVTVEPEIDYYTESSSILEDVVDKEIFNRKVRSSINSLSIQIGGGNFGSVTGQPSFWYNPIIPLDIRYNRFSHLSGKSGFSAGFYLDVNDKMALAVDVDPAIDDPENSDYELQQTRNTLIGCYMGYSFRMENRLGVELTLNLMPALLTVEAIDPVDLTNFNPGYDYPKVQMDPGESTTLFLMFIRFNLDLYYNITPSYYAGLSLDARFSPSKQRRFDSGFYASYSVAPVVGAIKLGYRF